jgi:hypothetical protein
MPGWKIAVVVTAFVLFDAMIVAAILWAVGRSVKELAAQFPFRHPGPDAIRKDFQSIHLGFLGLGGSVHLSADAVHLHIEPARVARWIGVRAMSLPWDAIRVKHRGPFQTRSEVAGVALAAPNWCMDLVNPPEPPTARAQRSSVIR